MRTLEVRVHSRKLDVRRPEEAIVARPTATPLEGFPVADTHRGRPEPNVRLLRAGLKDNRCERCGIGEWRGMELALALHHINGVRDDNRLENLELLCPNCHSQTETFAGRNRSKRHGRLLKGV